MVFVMQLSVVLMFGIVSFVMLVLVCIGCVNFGFLLIWKLRLSFIVLGIVRMFENRIVVLSGKCLSGCSVILVVQLGFFVRLRKLLVCVCVVLYLGRQWLVWCISQIGVQLVGLCRSVCRKVLLSRLWVMVGVMM